MTDRAPASAFPHRVLTRLHDPGHRPTRQKLLLVQRELNANARTVESVHGEHGHMFLTMPIEQYQPLHGDEPFVMPAKPTPDPVHGDNVTAARITENTRIHTNQWAQYRLMKATDRDLRNLLLTAADEDYWGPMCDPVHGFGTVTTLDLLTHMFATYGVLTEKEAHQAMSSLDTPWEGGPLETVIQRLLRVARELGPEAVSATFQRDKLYNIVHASNLLPDACQRWRLLPPAEKTWPNAMAHFQRYATDRDNVVTAGDAGFQTANLATQTTALRDLALQSALDAVTELRASLAATESAFQAHRLSTEAALQMSRNHSTSDRATRTTPRTRTQQTLPETTTQTDLYCWSHGRCRHTSDGCRTPKEGHQREATFENLMGGSRARLG